MSKEKGITLIALVITIVIIIILAVVSINFIFGANGIISRTEQARLEQNREAARETLGMVLVDALAEKQLNKEYNQDEFLDEFIYERQPESEVAEEEISLDGFTFELDRSVPQLGEYIGESGNLPARIRKIEVTNQTLSEVSVEVSTARAEGASYRYSYKKQEEGSYSEGVEQEGNTYTYTNLESQVIYNLRVELIKDGEVVDTDEINVRLGKLVEGALTFGDVTWSNGTANLAVSTTTENQIQYQIDNLEEAWKEVEDGIIKGIENDSDVYARLWDGTNGSDYISQNIEDNEKPVVIIQTEKAEGMTNIPIKAKIKQSDEESGINLEECRWIFNTNANATLSKEEYTEKFTEELEEINLKATKEGIYYLHVLSIDNAGNETEKISEPIKINTFGTEYITEGLIVWYDGNNNTGNGHNNETTTWKNLASDENDGVLNGGTWYDNYLLLDGKDDWLNLGVIKESNITIENVIEHGNGTRTYGINNFNDGGYGLSDDYSKGYNALIININKSYRTISSRTKFERNKIYSLSAKYNGESADFFENGQKYSLAIKGSLYYSDNTVTVIGGNPSGNNCFSFAQEKVYSVRIYNRALTDEEILQNYEVDKATFGLIY